MSRSGRLFGSDDNRTQLSYMLEYNAPGGFFGRSVANDNLTDTSTVRHAVEQVKALAEERALYISRKIMMPHYNVRGMYQYTQSGSWYKAFADVEVQALDDAAAMRKGLAQVQ